MASLKLEGNRHVLDLRPLPEKLAPRCKLEQFPEIRGFMSDTGA